MVNSAGTGTVQLRIGSYSKTAKNQGFAATLSSGQPGKVFVLFRYHVQDAVAVKADEGVSEWTAFPSCFIPQIRNFR
eukprot:13988051-Heterocapsa_arctica.AAC.1